MDYWWVNHKQTFRQEFGGKYVWCPKLKSNGRVNHFYETMREVQPGDLVYSYANAAVQGFGFATTHCYSCPKPDDFGKVGDAWDLKGWRVDVDFKKFDSPLRTADHTELIRPLLPSKYSPIKADGFGNQGAYFAQISEALALLITELADPFLLCQQWCLRTTHRGSSTRPPELGGPTAAPDRRNIRNSRNYSAGTRSSTYRPRKIQTASLTPRTSMPHNQG
jgi:hypothetical protein